MAGRPVWRGPFFQISLLERIRSMRNSTPISNLNENLNIANQIKVTARNNTIIPAMVGALLHVHNGKEYIPLRIQEDMVGHRLWEYVRTTKPFKFRATNAHKK